MYVVIFQGILCDLHCVITPKGLIIIDNWHQTMSCVHEKIPMDPTSGALGRISYIYLKIMPCVHHEKIPIDPTSGALGRISSIYLKIFQRFSTCLLVLPRLVVLLGWI